MLNITKVPPSLPLLLNRIEHYELLLSQSTDACMQASYDMTIRELQSIVEILTKDN